VISADETNAQEDVTGSAKLSHGVLETSFSPYQPRTFALHLDKTRTPVVASRYVPLPLRYDTAVASNNDTPVVSGFDKQHDALPADLLPASIGFDGIVFHLGAAATGKLNAVTPKGQTIFLPTGSYNRLYILAAADGDQEVTFRAGTTPVNLKIENWTGFIGQWDTRQWKQAPLTTKVNGKDVPLRTDWRVSANHQKWDLDSRGTPYVSPTDSDYLGLKPGFIKRDTLAWYLSHYNTADGLEQPYRYSYLFGYSIDLPANTRTVRLPSNANVHILAMTAAEGVPHTQAAAPLYDDLKTK
jgi:alpha-mannosidase